MAYQSIFSSGTSNQQPTGTGYQSVFGTPSTKPKPTSQPTPTSQPSGDYTNIGGKSYPKASIIDTKPKPTNIFQSALQTYTNIRDAVNKKVSEKLDVRKDEGLGATIGRVLQKTPNVDLGTKGQKTFKATDTETEIVNFISNFPSMVAQSWGQSLEQLSTKEGKQRLKQDAKNLSKTMSEVKTHIDNREWGKALETAMSNSALTVGLDVADFIPVTLLAKLGIKGSISSLRKIAQTVVKEAIEEVPVKPVVPKPVTKPKVEPKPTVATGGVKPKIEPKPKVTEPKTSGIAKQIEAKAVEKGMVDKGYAELAQYDSSTIKAQSKAASKYTIEDMNKIATGEKPLPKELKPGTPLSIAEDYAIKNNDSELLRKLAKSPLATQISESASELSLSRMRDTNSPVKIIRELNKVREEAFTKRYGGRSAEEVSERITKDVQKKVKIPDKYDWGRFVESIKC
jgi:hypothetical protein